MGVYRLRPQALMDLESIAAFIADDNPERAISFVDEIRKTCSRIADRPRAYQRRDDLAPGLRQAIHGRYLVLFTPSKGGIVIERVLHGARRLEDLL